MRKSEEDEQQRGPVQTEPAAGSLFISVFDLLTGRFKSFSYLTLQYGSGAVVQRLALLPHSQKVLGWNPTASFCVCVGFSPGTLASSPSPETRRLFGDSKLPIGVTGNGCVSLWRPHTQASESQSLTKHTEQIITAHLLRVVSS